MSRLLFALSVIAIAGCGNSTIVNGTLPCSSDGQCPSGYACQWDNNCWMDGTGPVKDMNGAPDAATTPDLASVDLAQPRADMELPATPPVAVWVSSGGGSATAQSGAELNLSVAGAPVAGAAAALSGSVISFGYLSCDTY